MPRLVLYHLTFPHGLHIGRGGAESLEEALEFVPSDTFLAAVLDTWHHLGRDVSDWLEGESDSPRFRLTSAFPFAGGVRFYPKPVDLQALFSAARLAELGAGKRVKKIRYLSEALFLQASRGHPLDDELVRDSDSEWACKTSLQGGALWMTEDEAGSLPDPIRFYTEERNGREEKAKRPVEARSRQRVFDFQTNPHVTVDRINQRSDLFQSEHALFAAGCGLWFGAAGGAELLELALSALGEAGLGGERSTGRGGFTWQKMDEGPDFQDPQECACLLSRWHPREEEIPLLQADGSAYRLDAVGGWLKTPDKAAAQRRKMLWLVAEGSLIAGNPRGDARDVRPQYDSRAGERIRHPVYRPGFALAVDWKRR